MPFGALKLIKFPSVKLRGFMEKQTMPFGALKPDFR